MLTDSDDFRTPFKEDALLPGWRKLIAKLNKTARYDMTKIAEYASARGVDAQDLDEALLRDFEEAYAAAGRAAVPEKIERIRRRVEKLRQVDPDGPWPKLDPPRKRHHARQAQLADLATTLRADIDRYVDECIPNAAESTRNERTRFILRMVEAAEVSLGAGSIRRLSDLFDTKTLAALKAQNWGRPGHPADDHAAIHNRCRLLEIGIAFAYDVLEDKTLGGRLRRFLEKSPSRASALKPGALQELQAIDERTLVRIGPHARKVIAAFGLAESWRHAMGHAQVAIGAMLVAGAFLTTGEVNSASFEGPERKMPGGGVRKTLVCPSAPGLNLEADFSAWTTEAIDLYWRRALEVTRCVPRALFSHPDGEPKASCTFAVALRKFARSMNADFTPELLRLAAIRLLFRGGAEDDMIAATLGIRQLVNLRSRFKAFADERRAATASALLHE